MRSVGLAALALLPSGYAFGQVAPLPPGYFMGSPPGTYGYLQPRMLVPSDIPPLGILSFGNQPPNTVLANPTGAPAIPVFTSIPSCSTASSVLQWTSDSGFGCGTIAGGGGGVGSANVAANTVYMNATNAEALPVFGSAPSCSTLSSALQWTSGSGLSCNTSINAATINGATGVENVAVAANQMYGNATGASAVPAFSSVPSCSTSASALQWTSGTGMACNTAVNAATLNGATFAAPGAIGGTTAGTGAFTTLSASGTLGATGTSTLGVLNVSGTTTMTGAQHIFNPPAGIIPVYAQTMSMTGTNTASVGLSFNIVNITSDVAAINGTPSSVFGNGFLIQHNFGGGATNGGRIGTASYLTQTAATVAGNLNPNYVALQAAVFSNSADGGTAGTAKGSYFGEWNTGTLSAASTFLSALTVTEDDITAPTGSSLSFKTGVLSAHINDTVQGSVSDNSFWTFGDTASIGSKIGLEFGRDDNYGSLGVASAGSLIAVGSHAGGTKYAAAYGLNFYNLNCTTACLGMAGFTVDNVGNVVEASYTVTAYSIAGLPTCNAGAIGKHVAISDANANAPIFFNAPATGGGVLFRGVVGCDGSFWRYGI